MAAARHNRPSIMVYGGTIQAGKITNDCAHFNRKAGEDINIGETFEAYGEIGPNLSVPAGDGRLLTILLA